MNFENNFQNVDINVSNEKEINYNKDVNPHMMGCQMAPVYECPEEKVCHRYICYEVPHIKPCNTRFINHHIYRHTFTPCHTCCEENVVENVYERRCH